MITVALAHGHTIVRQGLKLLLAAEMDFRLAGESEDGCAALELVAARLPDVLLLDLAIPRLHSLEVIRRVRKEFPATQVLVLSMQADELYAVEALRYGAAGHLSKDSTAADLLKAIAEVTAGRRYLSAAVAERALNGNIFNAADAETDAYGTLTKRECLVLQLAAEGNSSTEIGARLSISPRTAETHRTNLMRKLSLHSQTDLVRFAIRKQIIAA